MRQRGNPTAKRISRQKRHQQGNPTAKRIPQEKGSNTAHGLSADRTVRFYNSCSAETGIFMRHIIKGKQAPSSFHFVLMLKPEHVTALLEQAGESQLDAFVQSFLITVRFSDSVMTIVTGTAYKSFTLDKSADTLWDKSLQKFLTSRQIAFELMS